MDIEGSEYAALKGMPKAISNCRVLVVEFIPHHLKNVANITPDQFLAPLQCFKRAYIPELKRYFYDTGIRSILNEMNQKEVASSGIIFFSDEAVENTLD